MTFVNRAMGTNLWFCFHVSRRPPQVLPSECGKKEKRASSSTAGKNAENLEARVPSSSDSETDDDSWLVKLDEVC